MGGNSTPGPGGTTGARQPPNSAAERSSTHTPSLVLTQNLKIDYTASLGAKMAEKSKEPDEERKRNNTRESCALEFPAEVGMTISWLNLWIGTGLGTILGALGNWQLGARWRKWSERRA